MGHRPPWLPAATSHGGQLAVLAVWLPAFLVPGRFATEGLAWVRTSGGGRLGGLRARAPMAGHMLHSSARPLAAWGGGGGSLQNSLQRSLPWAPERRLHACLLSFRRRGPPPLSRCAGTGRAGQCCPSAALLRRGAGMPNVPPGAAVPHPFSHRGTRGALSVSVCRASRGVAAGGPAPGAWPWRSVAAA